MKRRALLGAIGAATLAGCTSKGSGDQEDRDELADVLEGESVHDLRSEVTYDVVLIQANRLEVADVVEYRHPKDAEIKTWDPGEDMAIVVAGHWVMNLSNESIDYPKWDQFWLVSPEGTHEPRLETPGGVSVDEIRDPSVSWPESEGLQADYSRGWNSVYVAPKHDHYALKWTYPEEPIYWRTEPI